MVALAKYSNRFGMTFGQLLSIISILLVMGGGFTKAYFKFAEIETRVAILELTARTNREFIIINDTKSELNRIENREDHLIISSKIDDVLDEIRQNR